MGGRRVNEVTGIRKFKKFILTWVRLGRVRAGRREVVNRGAVLKSWGRT